MSVEHTIHFLMRFSLLNFNPSSFSTVIDVVVCISLDSVPDFELIPKINKSGCQSHDLRVE